MSRPHRLSVTIATPCAAYLMHADPWVSMTACIFLAGFLITLGFLLSPAVWSRKKFRRDAAHNLLKLIVQSRKR
jgi:hypothetical protein